ncbi:HEAT repeat domain-containing protein [Limnospira fusiformis]|uniref:HEAT repeat domain-containing protein n=1 Tax=Limnospira fusiformis TaxID=54297 RepID=UPI001448B7AA|nr:NACHT domain-containing protein [Limnospira fusiformis SAG 85.79]
MWQDFLRQQAKNHSLSPEETETLLKRFPEKERYIKTEAQFTEILNEGISDVKHKIGVDTVTKRMQEIYKKFQADCPQLQQSSRGKLGILRQWLIEQFIIIDRPQTLNRCILGLKGNYQEAQRQLTEITTTLQNRLKDKTLSITKVEEGSIILIVESSQTGYEQLKTLINTKIGKFQVEYVIDEWQDICRRMLLKQKYLTINEIIGQVDGNRDRNLIDEDLFVDLALVKPKQSEKPKHPQDIDPERGSDFFTRQEVQEKEKFAYEKFRDKIVRERTEKNIAIVGEAGAGKTTLLQKLAFWLLQKTDDLVVWVSLAKLGNQPLHKYLKENWIDQTLVDATEQIKADWRKKFEAGAVWLLLDGFDEMSQSEQQSLDLQGWVSKAQIIMTCRLNLWQGNPSQLQGFQTYLTQPFQDEKMQEFIRRWFRGLVAEGEDVQLAESLWSELQESGKERIKDLCRNPLRLTLLCATWKVEDALPETMADLYAGFVESVYGWKETAFPVTEEEKEQLNAALGELAKASLEAETSRFRLTHRLVCEHLGKPKAAGSLFPLALKLSWLNEVGVAEESRREKVYTFYHATFQEYFAALAVEDWDYFLPKDHCDRPVEGKRYRIFEPQWKQVILLWLGREDVGEDEKEGFIRGLVEFKDGCGEWNFEKVDREFYEYQAYFLAAAGINEFKACSLAAGIVRQVVKWGLSEFDIQKPKWMTFRAAVEEGARKAIHETIRRLTITELSAIIDNCPDEDTRMQAMLILKKIDPKNAKVCPWNTIRISNGDKDTSRQASESPDKINTVNSQEIADLLEVIETSPSGYTRLDAVLLLEKIGQGNPQAISGLVKIMANTKSKDIRWMAAETLEKIGQRNPEAIANLQNIIANTESEDIRWRVAASLGRIDPGNCKAIAGLVNVITTTEDEKNRMWAAQSLGEINPGNPEAIAVLVKLIETTEDEDTRWRLALSLPKILTTPQQYAGVVTALKHNLSDGVDQNNFKRFHPSYNVLWNCAENLPYPEFYQAWHNPPTSPHSGEPSFASPLTCESLQHLPLYYLNADLLADETREREIALTLSELIWEITCPDEDPPEPATPAELRRHLKTLKRGNLLPHRAILFGSETVSTPTQPTPELMAFCQKLTGVIAIAFLTDDPLEAPLKGFPPNQRNLISAIETWLGEI